MLQLSGEERAQADWNSWQGPRGWCRVEICAPRDVVMGQDGLKDEAVKFKYPIDKAMWPPFLRERQMLMR